MENLSPAAQALETLRIPYQEYVHASPPATIEQAAVERNQEINQVVRSILFRLSEGEFAMVLIAGPVQVSWRALRNHFHRSRLTIASAEEVKEITGYEIGAVSPFGLPYPVQILVDEGVISQPAVSLGSGIRGTAILITKKNLLKALGEVEVGTFASYG
jgi:prolyl-tRNA editing enzyme YbaK/EbsC (Cys-tRNA(Pro) deacylase)